MKVVLDANVIVAAFATHGLCAAVVEVCLDAHEVYLSNALANEVRTNLRRKIKLPEETVAAIDELFQENARFHKPAKVPAEECRDPKDLHVLGLARAADADCIVTGDKDLLELKTYGRCAILTPRQFSETLRRQKGQS
ncbi:MAG: putative toxin-antitoxin system toxin component, PIN family [Verrucomicrobia subdivision 3 bacterium]|nr:putative toxin-antitoxin system toxin component, PIN family [Limisphaerales bacterium]